MQPKRILVAPCGFKGRLGASAAAAALAAGMKAAWPGVRVDECPLADGGAGTARAVARTRGGQWHRVDTQDAWGRPRAARMLALGDGTWVLEAAMGPRWEPAGRRGDPVAASSRGLGRLMAAARVGGAQRLAVGLGDSGATDGGLGLLLALGGAASPAGGPGLLGLEAARAMKLPPWDLPLEVWCDVDVPLVGPRGAVMAFGPQKGLDVGALAHWDAVVARWGALLEAASGRTVANLKGAGAAGGLGAGLAALGGLLQPGAVRVAEMVGLEAAIAGATAVITGEGRLDRTSFEGKAVGLVAALAHRHGVPTLAVVGEADVAAGSGALSAVLTLDTPAPTLARQLAAMGPRLASWIAGAG